MSASDRPPIDLSKPVLLLRRGHFWRLELNDHTIVTFRGKGNGNGGRPYTKRFTSNEMAADWANEAITTKISEGYLPADIAPPNDYSPAQSPAQSLPISSTTKNNVSQEPRRSGRKRSAPAQFLAEPAVVIRRRPSSIASNAKSHRQTDSGSPTEPPVKRLKRGMRGKTPVDTSTALGTVDPAANVEGTILTKHIGRGRGTITLVYDVMLVLVNTAKNQDKFIVLQLIERNPPQKGYVLYERWGRTGTSGNSLTLSYTPHQLNSALQKFESLFLQKTGLEWERATDPAVHGKYRFVHQNFEAKRDVASALPVKWQYWVDDGVDGKTNGWYDYDANGAMLVEQLFFEYQNNSWLSQRIVKSGIYLYLVDLNTMTQTNVVHPIRKMRKIRREEAKPPKIEPAKKELEVKEEPFKVNLQSAASTEPLSNSETPQTLKLSVKKVSVLKTETNLKHNLEQPDAAAAANTMAKKLAEDSAKELIAKITKSNCNAESLIQAVTASAAAGVTIEKTENVIAPIIDSIIEIAVDQACPRASNYKVVNDWDVTMNQTNITGSNNNNKYYKMQLLQNKDSTFSVWTRWGRVGETRLAQTKLMGPFADKTSAEKWFETKFKTKTGYPWSARETHRPIEGMYEPIKIDHTSKTESSNKVSDSTKSTLINETRELVELLFKEDMYLDALKEFDIDVKRMPLGRLSTEQIERGVDVLKTIEEKLKSVCSNEELAKLSSRFYTVLPHDFGRQRPPVIEDMKRLQRCYDMCNVLRDMEQATSLMNKAGESGDKHKYKQIAKVDKQYELLRADLRLLAEGSEELEAVQCAFEQTKGIYNANKKLRHVWRVERKEENERFKGKSMDNHQLLWHGSHIGSISAILANGLRIMPHSGGRVGRGIYMASENGKSIGYTWPALDKKIGCMFLAEAALGRICEIEQDNSSLINPPGGFDSVRACGRQSPPGTRQIVLDDVPVTVPVMKPVPQHARARSHFYQDEFVVYDETQVRIRYVVSVQF